MKVNSIQNNYNPQPRFTAGISFKVSQKIGLNENFNQNLMNKVDDIYSVNKPVFALSDVVYNAKNKTAKFFLTAAENVRNIFGLEKVEPQVITSTGDDIVSAFKNIDLEQLKKANTELYESYSKRYEDTKALREDIKNKRISVIDKIRQEYDSADSRIIRYYQDHSY